MHKIEIKIIVATFLLLLSFTVALMYSQIKKKAELPLCVQYDIKYQESHFKEIGNKTYEAFFVASMWRFSPEEIYIPRGSEVDIYLSAKDVVHGFQIEKMALNIMAVPGSIAKQTVTFNKPGIYKIVCHEYCGLGHQNMYAEIIVN